MLDKQIGGDHYMRLVIQPLEFMMYNMSQEEFMGYIKGNITKYIWREKDSELEDLRKAQHYLEIAIKYLEERS